MKSALWWRLAARNFLRVGLLVTLTVGVVVLVRSLGSTLPTPTPAPGHGPQVMAKGGFQPELLPHSPQGRMEAVHNAALPVGAVRSVGIDGQGTSWLHMAAHASAEADVFAVGASGAVTSFPDLRAAVEHAFPAILQHGSLPDFWALDTAGRVWVGPAHYDGSRWVEAVPQVTFVGGVLEYEQRAVVDANGHVWVPYHYSTDCLGHGVCSSSGVRAFDPGGALVGDIPLQLPTALAAYGIPGIRFIETGLQGTIVAAGSVMHRLEDRRSIRLQSLFDPVSGEDLPGFVAAASRSVDGQPTVYVKSQYFDQAAGPSGLQAIVKAETWLGGESRRIADLSAAPLFAQRPAEVPVDAQEPSAGAVWLASSHELGLLEADVWTAHYTARNSPLGSAIYDIAIGMDGSAWVATQEGVRVRRNAADWAGSGVLVIEALDSGYRPNWFQVEAGAPVSVKLRNLASEAIDIVFALGFTFASTERAPVDGFAYVNFQAPAIPGDYLFQSSSPTQRARGLMGRMHVVAPNRTSFLPSVAR